MNFVTFINNTKNLVLLKLNEVTIRTLFEGKKENENSSFQSAKGPRGPAGDAPRPPAGTRQQCPNEARDINEIRHGSNRRQLQFFGTFYG